MKKLFLLLVISSNVYFSCYSQIIFEKGYFINEANKRIDCLIKNLDWKYNPTKFEYKLSVNEEISSANIHNVKEFRIYDASKFVRTLVKLDNSSDDLGEITTNKNPLFNEKLVFLRVLIEGKASLYSYEESNLTRFFYKGTDSIINQFVYKYYLTEDNKIAKNNFFRQQLYNNLQCQNITHYDFEHIYYNKNSLEQFFQKYNECSNYNYENYEKRKKRNQFNLTIKTGLNSNNLLIHNSNVNSSKIDFGNQLTLSLGVEVEYILPFRKNTWSLVVETNYQYFKTEKNLENSNLAYGIIFSNVNFKSLEFPLGIRHYFYLNGTSKIFINASLIFDYTFNSSIGFRRSDSVLPLPLKIKPINNFAFGIGYKYNKKYIFEIIYQTKQELLSDYHYWQSDYKTLSFVFGYSIL
jgi:hypothetical protein